LQGTNLNTRQTRKLATVVPNMPSVLTAAGKWNLQRTGQWWAAAMRGCTHKNEARFSEMPKMVLLVD
jgi:hypothetical protein